MPTKQSPDLTPLIPSPISARGRFGYVLPTTEIQFKHQTPDQHYIRVIARRRFHADEAISSV